MPHPRRLFAAHHDGKAAIRSSALHQPRLRSPSGTQALERCPSSETPHLEAGDTSFGNQGEFQKFKDYIKTAPTAGKNLQTAATAGIYTPALNDEASWYVFTFCLGFDNNKWKKGPGYIDPSGVHTGVTLPLYNAIGN